MDYSQDKMFNHNSFNFVDLKDLMLGIFKDLITFSKLLNYVDLKQYIFGLYQQKVTFVKCLWSALVTNISTKIREKTFPLQHFLSAGKTKMATDLVPEVFNSPTFMWVFHSFGDLMNRFRPGNLLNVLSSDSLQQPLKLKGRDYYTGVEDLPDEIIVYIFTFLDHKELGKCERVCRDWKNLIDGYPELWSHVNLRIDPAPNPRQQGGFYLNRLSEGAKLNSYVNHLVGQGARIKSLNLAFEKYDESTYNSVAFLLSSGCCANLKSTSIKWSEDSSYGETTEFENGFVFYLSTLKLLDNFSGEIRSIYTQFNWTLDSVRYITNFKNLRVLDILCVPRVHSIQKWHVEKLLSSLQNLEEISLCVTIMPKMVQKFTLQSKSLRVLNISNCVNILIDNMDLPNLQYLKAKGMLCHRYVTMVHKSFCFYDVLQSGCPSLKDINDTDVDSSAAAFGLEYIKQCQMKICFCERHKKVPSA